MKLPKLTKAQKKMVEKIAYVCSDKMRCNDGFCEIYDITHGHKAKEKCLENLIKLGVVQKTHTKETSRYSWGGSSHNDDGFTLYSLKPVGKRMIYDKVLAKEKENTLGKRVLIELGRLNITQEDLESINIQPNATEEI